MPDQGGYGGPGRPAQYKGFEVGSGEGPKNWLMDAPDDYLTDILERNAERWATTPQEIMTRMRSGEEGLLEWTGEHGPTASQIHPFQRAALREAAKRAGPLPSMGSAASPGPPPDVSTATASPSGAVSKPSSGSGSGAGGKADKPMLSKRQVSEFEGRFEGLDTSIFGMFVKPSKRDRAAGIHRYGRGAQNEAPRLHIREKHGRRPADDPLAFSIAKSEGEMLQIRQDPRMHPAMKKQLMGQREQKHMQLLMQAKQEQAQEQAQDEGMLDKFHKFAASFMKHEDPETGQKVSPEIAFRLAAKMMPPWFRERMAKGDDLDAMAEQFTPVSGGTSLESDAKEWREKVYEEGKGFRNQRFESADKNRKWTQLRSVYESDRRFQMLVDSQAEKGAGPTSDDQKLQDMSAMLQGMRTYNSMLEQQGEGAASAFAKRWSEISGVDMSPILKAPKAGRIGKVQKPFLAEDMDRSQRAEFLQSSKDVVQGAVVALNQAYVGTEGQGGPQIEATHGALGLQFIENLAHQKKMMIERGFGEETRDLLHKAESITSVGVRAAAVATVGTPQDLDRALDKWRSGKGIGNVNRLAVEHAVSQRLTQTRAARMAAEAAGNSGAARDLLRTERLWEKSQGKIRALIMKHSQPGDPATVSEGLRGMRLRASPQLAPPGG